MATRDPVGIAIFNENGVFRSGDEDVEAYGSLWLLYHLYVSAISNSAQLAGSPEDVFETTGPVN